MLIRRVVTSFRQFLNIVDHCSIVRRAERKCRSAFTGTTGSSDAVNVGFRYIRQVVVNNHFQIGDVNSSCGNIRRNDDPSLPDLKFVNARCLAP